MSVGWAFAARLSDFDAADIVGVECLGQKLAIYRLAGELYASSDTCPHQGAALSEGCLVDGFVECPLHFALFDVRTGESDGSVTATPVRTYRTKLEDDRVYVDIP